MQTDLRLKFHNQRLGDGEIGLTLEHDEDWEPSLVGIGFSLHLVGSRHKCCVAISTGTSGCYLKRFAAELMTLAQTLEGVAHMRDDDPWLEMHFQVVDRDAGKIGMSGCVYKMSYGDFREITWPFSPAPDEGLKFLFSDIWVDARDLPAIADQIERFLEESGVYVGDDYLEHST